MKNITPIGSTTPITPLRKKKRETQSSSDEIGKNNNKGNIARHKKRPGKLIDEYA